MVADRAIGAVVGAVVGDAFGRPFEGGTGPIPEIDVVRHDDDHSPLRSSDDTALTLAVARWMLETAGADQDRLAEHLLDAYQADPNRGYGPGTARLLSRLADGGDWRLLAAQAFDHRGSLGNGAAMRGAPVAVAAAGDPAAAALLAARSAVITHTHPEGVDGAAVAAVATTLALACSAERPLDRYSYLQTLIGTVRTERMRRGLEAVCQLHPGATASEVIARVGNGVAAAESVPAAIACFLAYPDSFPAAVHFAVTLGGDTDTIASMTGAIAGARYHSRPSRKLTSREGRVGTPTSGAGAHPVFTHPAPPAKRQPGRDQSTEEDFLTYDTARPADASPFDAAPTTDEGSGQPDWWRSPKAWRTEVLAAMVVGIALIPEAISFSVVAHVDPRVGLFASFTMAVTISIVGGRRAMISAATGPTALVVAPLSQRYGLHYLVAAVLVIIAVFPRLNRVIPAPLVAIVADTAVGMIGHFHGVPTVGDKGSLPHTLPLPGLPAVPLSAATLKIIWLPALTMALVGLLETQMTARLVDDLTDTGSDKHRESVGQGIANLVSGIFGGMGGCAMIGQTMINVKAGARTRISTFLAGVFLLIMVVVLNPVVSQIPMAALVAVMFVVSYSTFDWNSIAPAHLKRMPKSETAVMLVTVILTVATGNLSIGVLAGVIAAALLFARRVQHIANVARITPDHHRWHLHLPGHHPRRSPAVHPGRTHAPSDLDGHSAVYVVTGELFFASSSDLADHFDYTGDPDHIIIDLTDSHIWDASTVAALDRVVAKYAHHGKTVELIGMNAASRRIHNDLAGQLASSH